MRRIANATGISPKMYRHFAVVTVGLTGILALFADGESREVVAAQIVEQSEKAAERRAETRKAADATFTRPLVKPESYSESSFDNSDVGGGGSYGAPMDSASGDGANASIIPEELGARKRTAPGSYDQFGLTQEQWEALSEEERERIRKEAANRKSASQIQREAEALKNASRNRAQR
ncbi:hypothetical protein [Altererythrobacter sp. ZODW24]|uniref:hypothetical protein n=1 Tax=Altererythrobacter sp. ZODW24 TaxID=2185142 RepID=UPI000DF7B5EF|nr:hypothetical protein [Altererythrobacter sp. ZODW24]